MRVTTGSVAMAVTAATGWRRRRGWLHLRRVGLAIDDHVERGREQALRVGPILGTARRIRVLAETTLHLEDVSALATLVVKRWHRSGLHLAHMVRHRPEVRPGRSAMFRCWRTR